MNLIVVMQKKMRSTKMATACGIVILSWLYALCSQVVINLPFGLVPISLQPLPLFFCTLLFGRYALVAYVFYLVQGAAGLPFFANGLGGLARLCGPTGGYLIGFLFAMIFLHLLRHWRSCSLVFLGLKIASAYIIVYFFGLVQLSFFVPHAVLFAVGLYPFLGGCLLKIAVNIFCYKYK